jgi:hypothetical protein
MAQTNVLSLKPAAKEPPPATVAELADKLVRVERQHAHQVRARNIHRQELDDLLIDGGPAASQKRDAIGALDEAIEVLAEQKRALQRALQEAQTRQAHRDWGTARETAERAAEAVREAARE